MKTKIRIMLSLCLILLVSCGGGGASNSARTNQPPAPTASSNWDSMVWDQDNWG